MAAVFLLKINFVFYCAVFIICLIKNYNFNIILVGLTYLAPIIPLGMTDANTVSYTHLTLPTSDLV